MATVPNPGPFKRTIKEGDTGDDVIAWKIITSRAGCWPWAEFDNIAHQKFLTGGKIKSRSGIRGLQTYLGVKADGVPGPATFKASIRAKVPKGKPHHGEYIWDGHAQSLYKGFDDRSQAEAIVDDIFHWWEWFVAHEGPCHYNQIRPMPELWKHHEPPQLPMMSDCSSTFSYCAFLGGARAPDRDYGYSGLGNTGSLVRSGFWIPENEAEKYAKSYYVGVLYGDNQWSTHHITAYRRPGLLYSMGNENAPERWTSAHQGPGNILCFRAYPVI